METAINVSQELVKLRRPDATIDVTNDSVIILQNPCSLRVDLHRPVLHLVCASGVAYAYPIIQPRNQMVARQCQEKTAAMKLRLKVDAVFD